MVTGSLQPRRQPVGTKDMERADGDHGNSAVVQVRNGFFLKPVVAGINQTVVKILIRAVALARFFFLGEDRFQRLRIALTEPNSFIMVYLQLL